MFKIAKSKLPELLKAIAAQQELFAVSYTHLRAPRLVR